jgi:hypothetical protein
MTKFRKLLAICVVLLTTFALTPRSYASVIYESVPDLTADPIFFGYCSDYVAIATAFPLAQRCSTRLR